MTASDFSIESEQTPSGKRTIRQNVWGNVKAYVGGRFWTTLGEAYDPHTETRVAAFLSGAEEY